MNPFQLDNRAHDQSQVIEMNKLKETIKELNTNLTQTKEKLTQVLIELSAKNNLIIQLEEQLVAFNNNDERLR